MINRTIKTIMILLMTYSISSGQNFENDLLYSPRYSKDSLIIIRDYGHKISMTWPANKNVKKKVNWQELLSSFQRDLELVIEDFPAFEFYRIAYYKDKNLVIDEVVGREIYIVSDENALNNIKSNIAILRDDKVTLTIEFNNSSELLDASIHQELSEAISKVKHIFYFSHVSPERHHYNLQEGRMFRPKARLKLFMPAGIRAGFGLNKPFIGYNLGLGLAVRQQTYISLQWHQMTSYNSELNRTQFDNFLIFKGGAIGTGAITELAFRILESDSAFQDIDLKYTLGYRTRNGVELAAFYTLGNISVNTVFGAQIGVGF